MIYDIQSKDMQYAYICICNVHMHMHTQINNCNLQKPGMHCSGSSSVSLDPPRKKSVRKLLMNNSKGSRLIEVMKMN